MDYPPEMIEQMARDIAYANGDIFNNIPKDTNDWKESPGYFDGRERDINEPTQEDYMAMVDAALYAVERTHIIILPNHDRRRA